MVLDTFSKYFQPGCSGLIELAAKLLSVFRRTYLWGQVFSVMNIIKKKPRSKLTHEYSNERLQVVATQDIMHLRRVRDGNFQGKIMKKTKSSEILLSKFGYKNKRRRIFAV